MVDCDRCGRELPADARFCPSCGAPVEAPLAAPREERKLATVLFADLVGSTEAASDEDPERTRLLLERFYDAMSDEIAAAGGTVEKFAGDSVMAAFGAPAAQEDHAERALHAALSMRRRVEPPSRLRIGVNTGDVVVGRARAGSSFVSGDPVNVAARLEQAARPDEILVGERTVDAVRGAFEFGAARTVDAKGKATGVACRPLERALSLTRPRGVPGLHRAFVGRDTELELLRTTYRRAVEQAEPHLVTILGDAGVGKTRLVRELWAWLAEQEPQPLQRTGRCLSYGRGVAYWPLAEILKEHLGILDTDSPETARNRLGERQILGLTLGLDVDGDLHPLAARDRLHEAWVAFLADLVRDRAAVVLVEDLHWAEPELLDLLERVLRDVHGPLYVLATARPELLDARRGWGARRNASLLWLEPLSPASSAELVERLVAIHLPERLRDVVVERAEGNPFFVEELIATLIDQRVLERRGASWAAREVPGGFEVPDSVQAVVSARIDLLPAVEKAALQAAAVIGRIFWEEAVRELLDGADPDLPLLEDRDFVRRRPTLATADQPEYAIKHALTREVAYASLPKARRARLHAAFAGWLERAGAGRDEDAAFLAHHYAEAVRPEDADLAWAGEGDSLARLGRKAVDWLERAAAIAIARYEIDDGLALLHRALELEGGRPRRAALWHAIGRAHAYKFDADAFWAAMENAIDLSDDDGARAGIYADLALLTASRVGMWARLPAPELVDGWVERALELAPSDPGARVKALVARTLWSRVGDRAAAAEASVLAEELTDPDLRSLARVGRSFAAFASSDYDEATAWAERAGELAPQVKDPDLVADVHGFAVLPAAALGRLDEARRYAALHDDVTVRLTPHHRVHGVGVLLEVEELAGGWRAIRELEPRAVAAVEANLDTPCVRNARSLLVEAVAAAALGEHDASRVLEARADEVALHGHQHVLAVSRIHLALIRGDLALLSELLGEVDLVPRHTWGLSASVARLDARAALADREWLERNAPAFMRPGTFLEPFALRALGRTREDDGMIRRAVAAFEAMGLDWHAAQTRAVLST